MRHLKLKESPIDLRNLKTISSEDVVKVIEFGRMLFSEQKIQLSYKSESPTILKSMNIFMPPLILS